MKKIKSFLSKEIDEYLRRVDFDISKIEYIFNEITLDELELPEGLHKYLREIIKKLIDEIVDGANRRVQDIIDEVVDQIDSDGLAGTLVDGMKKRTMTYEPVIHITDPICGSCYRTFGQWATEAGNTVTEAEINKSGTRIIVADDF